VRASSKGWTFGSGLFAVLDPDTVIDAEIESHAFGNAL